MNQRDVSILILDDNAGSFTPELETVTIRTLEEFEEIDAELNRQSGAFGQQIPDVIFLDSKFGDNKRGWRSFLPRLRSRFPNAFIHIMSELTYSNIDEEFEKDWGNWREIVALEDLINTDTRIFFFPKPPGEERLKSHIRTVIEDLRHREGEKLELTLALVKASLLAYSSLLGSSLQQLCREHFSDRKPVDPPYGFDMVVEEVIRKQFANRVHEFGLILATEEEGMQNRIYRRIREPRFFLFSDPLDGSSALRKFLKPYAELPDWHGTDLGTFLQTELQRPEVRSIWEEKHAGPVDFYSPTLSLTLAETDRVFASALISLFTGKLFLSVQSGNYVFDLTSNDGKKIVEGVSKRPHLNDVVLVPGAKQLAIGVREESGDALISGMPLSFPVKDTKPAYLLAQLKAKPLLNDAVASISYEHFSRNVQPTLKGCIDVDSSLQLRYVRNDFSPGPARVLFLSDLFQPHECEVFIGNEEFRAEVSEMLGKAGRHIIESYRLILANGEPLTEWIHWFAFLENDPDHSLVAYRLNHPTESRWKDDVKASMAPPEVCSAFKSGYLDIRTLYSSFLEGMHRYTDTVVVCHRGDPEIVRLFENMGFYDAASRGISTRISNALAELLKELESSKCDKTAKMAGVGCIKRLKEKVADIGKAGEQVSLDETKHNVERALQELQSSLEVLAARPPKNDRLFQMFVFVSRLFDVWIHPVFLQIRPIR